MGRIQSNDPVDVTPPAASFAPNEIEHESANRITRPQIRPSSHLGSVNDLILSPDPSGSGTPNERSITSSHRGSTPPSLQNGVCIPQRRYKGSNRHPFSNQNTVSFLLEDGSYLPVDTALRKEYTGLIDRDTPVLGEAGETITLRFEVSISTRLIYATILIDYTVARIHACSLPGELADMMPPEGY